MSLLDTAPAPDLDGDVYDLTGVPCPANSSAAIVRLELMEPGERLELWIDGGEPLRNVPETLAQEGHRVLERRRRGDGWALVVERGDDA